MLHRTLHQLLRVVELFEDERDVHLRLAGKPLASTVDAVLADQGERVGQQVERDREPPAHGAHHGFVVLECGAMFGENRHRPGSAYFRGFDGRSSTRLGRLRGSCRSRLTTRSATSSGAIFQSAPLVSSPLEKPVATEPGMT